VKEVAMNAAPQTSPRIVNGEKVAIIEGASITNRLPTTIGHYGAGYNKFNAAVTMAIKAA